MTTLHRPRAGVVRLAYDDLSPIEEMHDDAGRAGEALGLPDPLDRAVATTRLT